MQTIWKLGLAAAITLSGTTTAIAAETRPAQASAPQANNSDYIIATGDELQVFVWKNPDLSATIPVRPDGRITTPLVQDMQAQGKTPTRLASDLKAALSTYVQDPLVTVVVKTFAAPDSASAIRVIGSAVAPKTLAYRSGLTALDVIISMGGLPVYANGNGAEVIRTEAGKTRAIPLRLKDLLKGGDLRANVALMPGDVIRIPQRSF